MVEKPNATLACRSGVAFCKYAQFTFRHSEFRGATIQADNKLWKYPHDGLVDALQSRNMNANLCSKLALVG